MTRPSGWPGSSQYIPKIRGAGIVYCLTVDDTERVAAFLRQRGIDARAYSARLSEADREALELGLLADDFKVLVATVALGMGFDKPNLGFVIHYQRPGSAITYYQQVGSRGSRRRRRVRHPAVRSRGRRDPALLHPQRLPARGRHPRRHRRAGRWAVPDAGRADDAPRSSTASGSRPSSGRSTWTAWWHVTRTTTR